MLVVYGLMATVRPLSAGRLDWLEAWSFLLAYSAVAAGGQAWLMKVDPGLVQERSRWGVNTKAWDKWLVSANPLLMLVPLLVIGMDAGRHS